MSPTTAQLTRPLADLLAIRLSFPLALHKALVMYKHNCIADAEQQGMPCAYSQGCPRLACRHCSQS